MAKVFGDRQERHSKMTGMPDLGRHERRGRFGATVAFLRQLLRK